MLRSLFPVSRRQLGRLDEPFFSLQRSMNRLFEDTFKDLPVATGDVSAQLVPSVDVKETDKAVQIEAELPGVDEKDVQVTYKDGVLTIKGEKKAEKEETKGGYHLSERSYGSFFRSLTIDDIDADKIEANFAKGVLKVTLPKAPAAESKTKTIAIKTSK